MARGSGLGGLLALLGLALIFGSGPRKKAFAPGGYSYWSRTGILPHTRVIEERGLGGEMEEVVWPDYPQVTAETRLDPRTPNYQVRLAQKYPEELAQTRQAYAKTRKILGLRDYDAPPMPRESRGRR